MLGIRKIGNLYCFSFNRDGRPRFCIGGFDASYLTLFPCIFFIANSELFPVGRSISMELKLVYCLLFGSIIFTYTAAFFVNPGIAIFEHSEALSEEFEGLRTPCHKCEIYMNVNVRHCTECDVCILDRRFHCSLTGKCIGRRSMYFYEAFRILFLVSFAFSMICKIIEEQ